MSQSVCPNEPFVYLYDGSEGNTVIYEIPDDPTSHKVIEMTNNPDGTVNIFTQTIDHDYELSIYAKYIDGINVSETKQIWVNIRASEVPANFDVFEFMMEDWNGRKATYSMYNEDMGKRKAIIMSALKKEDGFNETYVSKIGFHFKGCNSDISTFRAVLTLITLSSSMIPHYCQPQEVIDFLGITTNDGVRFALSDTTPLTYDSVAELICMNEDFIEMETRTSWTERRKINEYKNLGSMKYTGGNTVPYMGLYQPPLGALSSSMFKGMPCQLDFKNMKTLDATKGDKLEVRWFGNQWMDITPKNEDDSSTVWSDNMKSILYLRRFMAQRDTSVKVTYRYGLDEEVPMAIKKCAILLTAKHILQTSQLYTFLLPEQGEYEDRYMKLAISLEYDAKNILKAFAEQTVIGGI